MHANMSHALAVVALTECVTHSNEGTNNMASDAAFELTSRPDGIIRLEYSPGTFTLDVARNSLAAANVTAKGPYRLMIVLSDLKDVDPEARKLVAQAKGPTAVALVMLSPLARLAVNVFLGTVKNIEYETRAFSNEADAITWLAERE